MAEMNKPPSKIDDATVLFWAWSGEIPFGLVSGVEIYGLAICQYRKKDEVYRFS